jgi:2-methylcitrate dehydratase PrpD
VESSPRSGTVSERLAEHVTTLRFEDLPAAVVDKAKDHFAYHLALALGGHGWEGGRLAIRFAHALSEGCGQSTIVGASETVMPLDAVFANAGLVSMGHLDDTVDPSGVHPGVVVFPAAWAIGEKRRVTGRELITATVAGYDMAKLGDPVATITTYARRPQYPLVPFCVAATVGRLLGLDQQRMANAIGQAAHAGAGVVEGTEFGWQVNSLLARAGTTAALLAETGGETARTVIEGEHGFYRAFYGAVPDGLEEALDTLGEEYSLMETTTKPFSASGANIPAMQATLELRASGAIPVEEIAAVRVVLAEERRGRDQYFEAELDRSDATPENAVASLRFRVAAILLDGCIGSGRAATFRDPEVQAMVGRIRLDYEPGHTTRIGGRDGPDSCYGRIEVTTSSGRVVTAERERYMAPRGDWNAWLRRDGERLLPEASMDRLVELVSDLENVDDVALLMAAARGAAVVDTSGGDDR